LTGNRFIDALTREVAARCLARSDRRTLVPGDLIAHRGDRVVEVYFPVRGAVSEIEEGVDGGSNEVTAIGPEGLCGVEALLDVPLSPFLRLIEVKTTAVVVPLRDLLDIRDRSADFHRLVHRYTAARLHGAGISIGCNARHDAQSRLARWLLRLNDRVGNDDFELTHETISLMLGVRRSTVTRVIAALVAAGAVAAARNAVRIVDRGRLETLCCSCYSEARELYETLYGGLPIVDSPLS